MMATCLAGSSHVALNSKLLNSPNPLTSSCSHQGSLSSSTYSNPIATRKQIWHSELLPRTDNFKFQIQFQLSKTNNSKIRIFKSKNVRVRSLLDYGSNNRSAMQQRVNEIINSASLLLVYRNVLLNPPSQSFLRLVLLLKRREDSAKVSEAFGEFYQNLAIHGHSSWKSFVLDKILEAENNPFAKASSGQIFLQKPFKIKGIQGEGGEKGGQGQGQGGGEEGKGGKEKEIDIKSLHVPSSLYAAAYSDLFLLQKMAISENSLCEMMNDFVDDSNGVWKKAISSSFRHNFPVHNLHNLLEHYPEPRDLTSSVSDASGFGFFPTSQTKSTPTNEGQTKSTRDNGFMFDEEWMVDDFSTPLSIHETHVTPEFLELKNKINNFKSWSDAIELLKEYYFKFGNGVSAYTPVVECKNGKLFPLEGELPRGVILPVHEKYRLQIEDIFQCQLSSPFPNHILIQGESSVGKSNLIFSILGKFLCEKYFRVIVLDINEIKNVGMVISQICNHPYLRFCVFVDNFSLKPGDASISILKSYIDGFPKAWPKNAFLLAISHSSGLVRSTPPLSAPAKDDLHSLTSIFHTTVRIELDEMQVDQWASCVVAFADHYGHTNLRVVEEQAQKHWVENESRSLSAALQLAQSLFTDRL